MEQKKTQAQRIVLWGIAIDPLFLAGIAYFLNTHRASEETIPLSSVKIFIIIFSVVSLAAAGLSIKISSSAFKPKILPGKLPEPLNPLVIWKQITVALALAIIPGIFGFVLSILLRNNYYLLLFNGGALALAAWHIMNFENAR